MLPRNTLPACALIVAAALPALATAQISGSCKSLFADQALKIIVPNAAGGGYDIYARALAPVIEALSGLHATVINMPAAGGLVAMTTLADSQSDALTVLLKNGTDVLLADLQEPSAGWSKRLERLAVFHTEPSAWLGRADFSIQDADSLVAASSMATANVEFGFGAQALGKQINVISGYGGKETELAVLRGDADVMSSGLTTALKVAKSGDLSVQLLLSDAPSDRAPGVPHLAGEDGLAAQSAKDLPAEERAKRMELAKLVMDLSYDVRTVFTHSSLRPDLKDCLTEALADAIRDPAFAEAAQAQGRSVDPMDAAQASALLASQMQSAAKLTQLIAAQ